MDCSGVARIVTVCKNIDQTPRNMVNLSPIRPHHFILVGVQFDLGVIQKTVLQLYLPPLYLILQHPIEYFSDHTLYSAAPKAIDRPEV